MLGLEVDFLPPFCFGWKHVLFWYISCRQQPPYPSVLDLSHNLRGRQGIKHQPNMYVSSHSLANSEQVSQLICLQYSTQPCSCKTSCTFQASRGKKKKKKKLSAQIPNLELMSSEKNCKEN